VTPATSVPTATTAAASANAAEAGAGTLNPAGSAEGAVAQKLMQGNTLRGRAAAVAGCVRPAAILKIATD